MIKRDLLTNEEFHSTRINQKFANAKNRIKFYNDKANKFRQSIAFISKPLQNNIMILNELMAGKKECVFHKEYLLGKGYSLSIHSHIHQYQNKNHFAIHNFIIMSISETQIKIIKI
jgi:hypothetical protein